MTAALHPWSPARFPGDAVLVERLERAGEIGEVIIERWEDRMRVASYLPGKPGKKDGDVIPEFSDWADDHASADRTFDRFVAAALSEGWTRIDA